MPIIATPDRSDFKPIIAERILMDICLRCGYSGSNRQMHQGTYFGVPGKNCHKCVFERPAFDSLTEFSLGASHDTNHTSTK